MNETGLGTTPETFVPFWRIAKITHETHRAYCAALGDDSLLPWEQAPEWQKDSVGNGVAFHLQNPTAGPEASHENWLRQKIAEGWIYGPVKDPEKKQHPCMVSFAELPKEQQIEDHLFRAIVHACM